VFFDATIEFDDISKPWLSFVADADGCSPFDWIKSGTLEEQGCAACNDFDRPGDDNDQNYEKVLDGQWAPYLLAARDIYREEAEDGNGDRVSICSKKYGVAYQYGHTSITPHEFQLQNVDIILTSDQSKWTRSPVIEMCEYDTTGGFSVSGLSEGDAIKFNLRNHLSVDKDGNLDGELDTLGNALRGMGWFPGYAINVNTGQRLNIMFGEDSRFVGDNGRDMIWNPSSRYVTDLYLPGAFSDVAVGDIVWGGKHVIYVVGSNIKVSDKKHMPVYDEGQHIYYELIESSDTDPTEPERKRVSNSPSRFPSLSTER